MSEGLPMATQGISQLVTQDLLKFPWEFVGDLQWITYYCLPMATPKDFWHPQITDEFFKMSSAISKEILGIPLEGVARSPLKIS